MVRKISFYRHTHLSDNNVMRTVFMSFLKSDSDEMLKSVVTFKTATDDMVPDNFTLYASPVIDF